MRLRKAALAIGVAIPAGILFPGTAAAAPCTPESGFTDCEIFDYTGADQTLTVPAGTTTVTIKAWGAGGGGTKPNYWRNFGGAAGGFTTAAVPVTPGVILHITVGQGGVVAGNAGSTSQTFGRGGAGGPGKETGASGGGLSAVWRGAPFVVGNQLVIAGGGGGSSPGQEATNQGNPVDIFAGAGGGLSGNDGGTTDKSGSGGTQTAGGRAATNTTDCATQQDGTQFTGGAGASAGTSVYGEGGGGGGAGWFGGGGGRCQASANAQNGSGGGGSSYFIGTGMTIAGSNPSAPEAGGAAPNTTDFHYSFNATTPNFGVGGGKTNGGNGRVVIQYLTVHGVPETFTGSVNLTGTAATAIANVRSNDKIRAATATSSNSVISQVGTWPTGISLDTSTGAITYTNAAAPGVYTVSYRLCDLSNPAKCVTVADTITLNPVVVAANDSVTNVNGANGATDVLNVYAGDTVNGAAATTTNATVSVATTSSLPTQLTFNTATGSVGVKAGTAAGVYTFNYTICSTASPVVCKTASVSVTVAPSVDLQITKTDGKTQVFPGETINYTITVTNAGPDPVTGAVVRDVPGAGTNCTSTSTNLVTITGSGVPSGSFTFSTLASASGITLGTLNSGQSAVLSYSCKVN